MLLIVLNALSTAVIVSFAPDTVATEATEIATPDPVAVWSIPALLALQAERDRALRACLKPPVEGEHVEATKAKIRELLRQNEAILKQVNAAKVRLLEEMRESQQNHRAVSAYLTSAR